MSDSIHENPSIDILKELKLAGNNQIITHNENQFDEISRINLNHIENLQYLKPFISNSSNESQYDVAALAHLLSLQRNKMRVLAYIKKRSDQLKAYRWNYGKQLNNEIQSKISKSEERFFNEYCSLIDEYNKSINNKYNIPDSDICNHKIGSSIQGNFNLCQIISPKIFSKDVIEFNNGRFETKSQQIFYNSGSFSFFTKEQVTCLGHSYDITPIQRA
ncbi:DNA replication complex GINS PSF1 isoform X1 [Cryptosporidium sp. chipmunk genotype I]|uniref:DNA replication complex GINS PSF1 isoform X1 n=1 Tax=Cryptosporidium sp. chipmunk genotype I TaxID=1280935 RepID=UPI00351A3F45|nr:DNA replication complex GINS PSF1 isoform X1 [Cryptosporidium sp. chipmunk genotype I]